MALTGYETVTTFHPDYNVTQSLWYGLVPGHAKPGTLCDPHVFNVGDSFTTNNSLFEWKVMVAAKGGETLASLVYTGSTLETCDITALYLNGDFRTRTTEMAIIIACEDLDGFSLIAQASFSGTSLAGKSAALFGTIREVFGHNNVSNKGAGRSTVLERL